MRIRSTVVVAAFVGLSSVALSAAAPQTGRVVSPDGQALPGTGVTDPVPTRQVEPKYTQEAMRAKIEGQVVLQAVVKADGHVGDIQISKSLEPDYGLSQEAIRAARQWLFKPATKNGKPVDAVVTLVLAFHLKDSKGPTTQTPDDEFGKGAYPPDTAGLVKPKGISQPAPGYTTAAMQAKIQGDVELDAVVAADGTIARARVSRSLDKVYGLDDQALAAVKTWTFEPGTVKGAPVPVLVKLLVSFRLH